MNDLFTTYEFVVAQKAEGHFLRRRILFILMYIAYVTAFLTVGIITRIGIPLVALVPVTTWILIFFTWRYVQVEYEYSYFTGALTVSRILGNRTRKKLLNVRIQELAAIFPYGEANTSRIEAYGAENVIFAASSQNAENLYVALWQDAESGKRCVLFFEPNEKAIKILKYYNMSAFSK